jgi:hypothetical protein
LVLMLTSVDEDHSKRNEDHPHLRIKLRSDN